MSVEKQFDTVMLLCDECEEPSSSHENFHRMIQQAKKDGWFIAKDGEEWVHLCPYCKKL